MLGAAGAGAWVSAAVSAVARFDAGLAEAFLVFGFCLGIDPSGRGGLASAVLGLAGAVGCGVVAVVSAEALPRPTLRARLEKKPSDSPLDAGGATAATRVGEDA